MNYKIIKILISNTQGLSCWVYHGVIILNRSNNSVFLYLNSAFESINMGLDHKLFLQLFVIGFCLFCSRIGKRKVQRFPVISGYCLDSQRDFHTMHFQAILRKSSLTADIFLRALSNPFFKSTIPLGYPKILMIVGLIII